MRFSSINSKITTVFLMMTTTAMVFIVIRYSESLILQLQQNVKSDIVYSQSDIKDTLEQAAVELFPEPFMLANIPNFTYVLNRDICRGEPVDLLVLVGSHPGHCELRKVLRETWGAVREDKYVVKLMFPIGRTNDSALQQQMIDESAAYGDIVQGSFVDAYNMVTIRDVMSFHWTWKQCPQARFVMHIDDDICMDIDHVLDALEEQMPKDKDYVACFLHFAGEVFRTGHLGLSKQEHPADTYDPYCSGWAYWFTPRAAKQLDMAALRHFPYRMNDAYLTGTLMKDLGWKHLTLKVSWTGYSGEFQKYLNTSESTVPEYFLGHNDKNATLARLVHERFHKYSVSNRIPRNRP